MSKFVQITQLLGKHNNLAFALLLTGGAALGKTAQAQVVARSENAVVSATVTSLETSPGSNGWRYLTASVHFQNLTKEPIVLGIESSKVKGTDDRGNGYAVTLVRGMGEIVGTRVDAKFVLPAGGGGDALVEMRWRGDRNAIFGTLFDLTLPVRVILPLEGGQYKLGTEYLVRFSGLKAGHVAIPAGAPLLPENTVNAGPFTVQIKRLTPTISGNRRWRVATLVARIVNTSDKPLTLAYESTSSYGIDDHGNRYNYGTAGAHDTSFSGIGLVTSLKADPQLVLAPRESREVQFTVIRAMAKEEAGKQLTYYVALLELEVLPSKQIQTVRQYSLAFARIPGLN